MSSKNPGVYKLTINMQLKVLTALWRDSQAFNLYRDVVKPRYFSDGRFVDICRIVFDYYDAYNQPPTLDVLVEEVNELCDKIKSKGVAKSEYLDVLDTMSEIPLDDLEYVKDKIITFGKRQALVDAIMEGSQILDRDPEEYVKIEKSVRDALLVGENVYDLGTNVFENIEERFTSYLTEEDVIERIPTDMYALDACLGGGLGRTEMGVIVAAPGLGKCLEDTTPVLTPDGYTLIGLLKPGDKVISVDGTPTTVTAVYHHTDKPLYRVKFTFGECVCCDEHLWTIEKPQPLTLPLKRIMHMMDKGQKVTIPTLANPVQLSPMKNCIFPIEPYKLGLILGGDNDYYLSSEEIRFLVKNHISPDEPEKYQIPKEYLYASVDDRIALFKGLIDACSWLNQKMGYYAIYTKSFHMLQNIKFLAESLCCNTTLPGNGCIRIYNYHRINLNHLGVKQKNYIKSIKYVGSSPATCITVDHPSQLYLIKDGIVTHNTTTLVSIGAAAVEHGYNVLHVSLENNEKQITRNYDLRLLRKNLDYVKENMEQSIAAMFNVKKYRKGQLRIKKYPTRGASVQTIRTLIDKYKLVQNFVPDVVVVDYGTILKSSVNYMDKRNAIESNFEELRALADDYNIALWTAAQGNRGALSKKVVTMGDLAECFAIGNICDVMACLCQTMQEKVKHELRMFLPKIRDNADKMILKGSIQYDIKKVEMYDRISADDQGNDDEDDDWDAAAAKKSGDD